MQIRNVLQLNAKQLIRIISDLYVKRSHLRGIYDSFEMRNSMIEFKNSSISHELMMALGGVKSLACLSFLLKHVTCRAKYSDAINFIGMKS